MHTPTHDHDSVGHFKGKDAIDHVIEAQAKGILSAAEVHGIEAPGHISAACDAARDSAVVLSITWIILQNIHLTPTHTMAILAVIACGWLFWKGGRSTWLAWFRLERLHRILEQERYEIEHHRTQERDELRVLYATKGFEGKLLEDVLDVLMADNDRLLKVMVEEELGLSLASYEHPLKQGLGAVIGVVFSGIICLLFLALWPQLGILIGAALAIAITSGINAHIIGNKQIPAIIWSLGIAALAIGSVHFLLKFVSFS